MEIKNVSEQTCMTQKQVFLFVICTNPIYFNNAILFKIKDEHTFLLCTHIMHIYCTKNAFIVQRMHLLHT